MTPAQRRKSHNEANRRYREKNKEKVRKIVRESQRRYRETNLAKVRESNRILMLANYYRKKKRREYQRNWMRAYRKVVGVIKQKVKDGNEKWKELEEKDRLWNKYQKMIPTKLLNEILNDDYYKKCCRHKEGTCKGRITFEHAFIYAGKQIQEKWAILPLCAYHHEVDEYQDGGGLEKNLNHYLSLQRAREEDLEKYPRKNWSQIKTFLHDKYKDY